jgi:hypothetical protein
VVAAAAAVENRDISLVGDSANLGRSSLPYLCGTETVSPSVERNVILVLFMWCDLSSV